MDSTVVLAAAASLFFVILIFGIAFLVCRSAAASKDRDHRRNNQAGRSARTRPEPSGFAADESASFDPCLSEISMAELAAATENFSTDLIVGDGSFGMVYRAQLSNGVVIAAKKLDHDALQGFREFRAEMETLGRLRHPNIVQILGYCISGPDRVLIYEFLERGSLDYWLHDTSNPENAVVSSLSWATRLRVAHGVAKGLAYLHGLEKPIIHRDIKSSNVLLDSDYEAHIADFGLARRIDSSRSHVSTQVAGTMGYMPPEYKEGNTAATVMADAYSFGILLVEIASQRRPNLPVVHEGREMGLIQWTTKMAAENRHYEILDANIRKESVSEEKVREYFRIACICSSDASRERPAMKEVVHLLENLLAI